MKRIALVLVILFSGVSLVAQKIKAKDFQESLNIQFANEENSPLSEEDRAKFTELPFFKISNKYRIKAKFVKAEKEQIIRLKTTTKRLPAYRIYGKVYFEFEGEEYQLTVYQSNDAAKSVKYKNDLFVPFTDATNGKETYGGGRYLDLKVTEGNSIILDFNKAYNPYCAYNEEYSCPIVPKENNLAFRVEAGVKYEEKH